MFKKKGLLIVLVGCVAFATFSCKSEPATVTDEPAAPVTDDANVAEPIANEVLTALRAEVTQLRAQVLEFGFNVVDETLWTDGETAFQSAESSFGKNDENATSGYEQAKSCYKQLMTAGFTALADKISAARKDAADAGADKRFPDQFNALNDESNRVAELRNDPNVDASKAFADCSAVLDGYTAMTVYMLGDSLKKRVVSLNLVTEDGSVPSEYDPTYKAGCDALVVAEGSLGSDVAASLASARTAVSEFSSILDAWFKKCTDEESAKVNDLIARCDEVKAPVAVKDSYATAAASHGKARQLYDGKSYEAAYNEMQNAGSLFEVVYGQAVTKRDAALRAMDEAKKSQESASSLAAVADEKIPLEGEDEPEIPLPGEEPVATDTPVAADTSVADDVDAPAVTDTPVTDDAVEPVATDPVADDATLSETETQGAAE